MSAAPAEVRRLCPDEAALYREIRLEALCGDPAAFASTYAAEASQPLSWFADRLGRGAVFGAFVGAQLSGVAGFLVKEGPKQSHKGSLLGMYVRPAARRAGIGRALVETVIAHACRHVELLQLTVVADNAPARLLYAGLGFVEYGFEQDALKQNGRYYDEVLMALPLVRRSESG
jgi:ribosomal protein S18 acetylase RimI-like enzyme